LEWAVGETSSFTRVVLTPLEGLNSSVRRVAV